MSQNNLRAASDLSDPVFMIMSDKDVHFTTAIAAGAMETENLTLTVNGLRPAVPTATMVIWGISIIAADLRAWRVVLFRNNTFQNADLDLDTFVGSLYFHTTQAFQIGGAGPWYYDSHGTLASIGAPDLVTNPLPLPYRTDDGFIHVGVQNMSGVAKTVGANFSLRFLVQAMGN